jgi:hypothetical protein
MKDVKSETKEAFKKDEGKKNRDDKPSSSKPKQQKENGIKKLQELKTKPSRFKEADDGVKTAKNQQDK